MNRRQSGFAHIGILLIILVLAAAGFTGWWVWHNNKSTKKSASSKPASSQATNTSTPAAAPISTSNWKSYTTTYEKFSFKYPTDWTLKSTPLPYSATGYNCATPGTDQISLTAPDGSKVQLTGGINCIGGAGGITVNNSSTIQALGKSYYIVVGDFHADTPAKKTSNKACLSSSATEETVLAAKNVTDPTGSGTTSNIFCYTTPNFAIDTGGYYSTADFNNLTSFKQAKLVFGSLSY